MPWLLSCLQCVLDLEVLDPKQVEGHRKPSRLDADPIGYGLVVVVRCLISKLVDDCEGLIRSGYHHQGVTRIKGKGLCFNSPRLVRPQVGEIHSKSLLGPREVHGQDRLEFLTADPGSEMAANPARPPLTQHVGNHALGDSADTIPFRPPPGRQKCQLTIQVLPTGAKRRSA